jgi:hypothetical protein
MFTHHIWANAFRMLAHNLAQTIPYSVRLFRGHASEQARTLNPTLGSRVFRHQPRSQSFRVRTSGEKRKPSSGPGHVIWAYLTATRQGVAKYSNWNIQVFEINKQPKHFSINRYYLCTAKFGTNQLKSLKTPSMFSKIYRYLWRFSIIVTGKAKCTTVSQHNFQAAYRLVSTPTHHSLCFILSYNRNFQVFGVFWNCKIRCRDKRILKSCADKWDYT